MRVGWLLAAFACGVLPARGVEKEAPAERLRQLVDEEGRIKARLREVEERRSGALRILDQVNRERQDAQQEARSARNLQTKLASELVVARRREDQIRAFRLALSRDVSARLLARYRMRTGSYLRTLLSAPSIGDVLWRRRMMDKVLQTDLALVTQWADAERTEAAARADVERRQELVGAAEQSAQQRDEIARRQQTLENTALAGVLQKRSTLLRTIDEIGKSRESTQRLIETLPPPPEGLGGFGQQRGKLPWPADGSVEVRFGRHTDPRLRTVLRQKGYDLRAPEGAPVKAPYPAIVGYSGWFSGFGNLVILDHGEGYYTLYAHLKDLQVARNQRVEEGTVLGDIGDTGSLKGPYLYFEIRSGSKPLDPADWLKRR
jgi:septal ring factor EnvC (AmiA/AmiB activator)